MRIWVFHFLGDFIGGLPNIELPEKKKRILKNIQKIIPSIYLVSLSQWSFQFHLTDFRMLEAVFRSFPAET